MDLSLTHNAWRIALQATLTYTVCTENLIYNVKSCMRQLLSLITITHEETLFEERSISTLD